MILTKLGQYDDDGSYCEKVSEFLMVRFSYKQTIH